MTDDDFTPALIEVGPFPNKEIAVAFKNAVKRLLNDAFTKPTANTPVDNSERFPLAGMNISLYSSRTAQPEIVNLSNTLGTLDPEEFKLEFLLPARIDANLAFATIERALEPRGIDLIGFDPTNIFATLSAPSWALTIDPPTRLT